MFDRVENPLIIRVRWVLKKLKMPLYVRLDFGLGYFFTPGGKTFDEKSPIVFANIQLFANQIVNGTMVKPPDHN